MADNPCILVKRSNSDSSCCGIVLDSENGIVLTLASLFTDLLPEIETRRPFSIHCPDTAVLSQDYFAATSQNGQITVEVVIRRNGQEAFRQLQGRVILFWRDEGIQRIAERIFPSSEWKFESLNYHHNSSELKPIELTVEGIRETEQPQQNGIFVHQSALSDFVLIQVKNLKKYLSCKPLTLSTWRSSGNPQKGDTVFVVGTPFGCECPPVFYNSVSKGIVSNLIGANNEFIITDARCIPGCEGCTMYLNNSQSVSVESGLIPHGIILAPFCWRNGEWIGIAVACSLKYLLDNLRKLLITKFPVMPQNLQVLSGPYNQQAKLQFQPGGEAEKVKQDQNSSSALFNQSILNAYDVVQAALAGVVMVQCGMSWGSGIVLDADEGLIATCSHVIRGYQDSLKVVENKNSIQYSRRMTEDQVCCLLPNGISHNAQVLYATREGFPLDFALLKIQPSSSLRSLKPRAMASATHSLSNPLYKKGEGILVIGFPLFASHQHTKPSIVSGVLSSIAFASNHAVLLQSSAAVHCGASGGALVSMETGELLGMVTSHTKDVDMASAFPHVNFSIPVELLCKLVLAVRSGVVEDDLQALVSDHTESIWKLKNINESPEITSKL